jgi:FkbM family methyltransferase
MNPSSGAAEAYSLPPASAGQRMKNAAARGLLTVLRLYVRYFPLRVGKVWLYRSVIEPYLAWRPFKAVARMRGGARVNVQLPDQIQSRIYFFGLWEPEISHYMTNALVSGDIVIDVGANIGYFALLAAALVGMRGGVSAVEASPNNFEMLARNVSRSGLRNITLHHQAAAAAPGRLQIFLGPAQNRGATTTVTSVASRKGQPLEAEVPADTLAAIVGEERLLSARLIKVDIEGAEYSMMAGIAHLLPRFPARTEWLLEISPQAMQEQGQSVEALLGMFRSAGYELYRVRNDYSDASYFGTASGDYLDRLTETPTRPLDILARKRK